MLCARFDGGASRSGGGGEAQERVLRESRDVGRAVGVNIDCPMIGLLEVDEETGYKDCCQAVW